MARAVALLLLLAVLPMGVAAPARASCAEGAGPEGSDVIFVGVAREERRGYTRFDVREVWAGPDLAPSVWVLSGEPQGAFPWFLFQAVGSSTDADFWLDGPGQTWVVGASSSFSTGACSVASADEGGVQPPAEVRQPVASGLTGADPPASWWEIGGWLLLSVAGVVGLFGWRRRRRLTRAATPPPATAPPAPPAAG